jgi:hypothetical protein
MCMQCVGAVATAFNAATIVGGPIVAKHYQRVRAVIGLPDNSVAAVEARAAAEAAGGVARELASAPVHSTGEVRNPHGRPVVGHVGIAL